MARTRRAKERREQAAERDLARSHLSPEHQLSIIKNRRGESRRERERLEAQLKESSSSQP